MVNAALTRHLRSNAMVEPSTVNTRPAAESWSMFSDKNWLSVCDNSMRTQCTKWLENWTEFSITLLQWTLWPCRGRQKKRNDNYLNATLTHSVRTSCACTLNADIWRSDFKKCKNSELLAIQNACTFGSWCCSCMTSDIILATWSKKLVNLWARSVGCKSGR